MKVKVGDKVRFLRLNIKTEDIKNWINQPMISHKYSEISGVGKILDIGDKYYVIDENGIILLSRYVESIKDEIVYVPKDLITVEGKLVILPDQSYRCGLSFYYNSSLKMWCTEYGTNITSDKEEFKLTKINSIEDMKDGYLYYDGDIDNKEELGNYENYGIKIGDKLYYYVDNTVVYIPLTDYDYDELYEVDVV